MIEAEVPKNGGLLYETPNRWVCESHMFPWFDSRPLSRPTSSHDHDLRSSRGNNSKRAHKLQNADFQVLPSWVYQGSQSNSVASAMI